MIRIGFDGRALASPAAGMRPYTNELLGALALLDPAAYAAMFPGCDLCHSDLNADDQVTIADKQPFATALLGPSITVPFTNSTLALGTWQQIMLLEFDTRPRRREVVIQMLGE